MNLNPDNFDPRVGGLITAESEQGLNAKFQKYKRENPNLVIVGPVQMRSAVYVMAPDGPYQAEPAKYGMTLAIKEETPTRQLPNQSQLATNPPAHL